MRTVTAEGPGRWRTVGAGSAVVPGAIEQKTDEVSLFINSAVKCSAADYFRITSNI